MSTGQREFTRVATALDVRVESPGGETRECTTRNVAMKGCFAECREAFAIGTEVAVTILLGGSDQRIPISARGRVAYRDDHGMGIEFVELLGLESYEHLRNLVLYNASEPNRVEDEFDSHLGIRRLRESGTEETG